MRTPLVGRERELGELVAALDRAGSGAGGAVLVVGPAGIGKSRLCEELHGLAGHRGTRAAWTTCWESLPTLALAPWVDLLQQLGEAVDVAASTDDPAVAVAVRLGQVAAALRALAAHGPHLLVVDDLQWAEPESLQVLARLLGVLRSAPILVVATVRTDLAGRLEPAELADLARHCEVVTLAPLDDDAIAALADAHAAGSLDGEARDDLVVRAAGNPLFARELASMLASADPSSRHAWLDGASHGVPHALRSLLLRPLEALPGPVRDAVAVVAVAGDHATPGVVAAAAELADEAAARHRLQEAERAGVVVPHGEDRVGLHHPLLRAAILEQLVPAERAELHLRVGQALERRAEHDPSAAVAAAEHLVRGATAAHPERVADAALRGARTLASAASYGGAAALVDRAAAAATADRLPPEVRCELLLASGAARWAAGDPDGGRAALLDAATVASSLGRFDLLARAALALGGPGGFEVKLFDRVQVQLLQDALDGLGAGGDPTLRSWLSARLSVALSIAGSDDDRARLAQEAVELAREGDDPAALAHALAAWCDVHAGPDHVRLREAAAGEIVDLARQVRDPAVELLGLRLRVVARLEAGDLAGADADIEAFGQVAGPLEDPRFDWVLALWRAMRALHDQRVDDFTRWNDQVRERGEEAGSDGASVLAVGQRWLGLIALGRDAEAARLWEQVRPDERFAHLGPMMAAPDVLAAAVAGDRARAERLLAAFDLDAMPKDSEWLSSVSMLAEVAVRTEHREAAARVRAALEPYADLWAIDGIGGAIRGPVRGWLDALAAVGGVADTDPAALPPTARFARDGDVWTVAFAGIEAHVRDTKGMRDLAALLARPGQEVTALDLYAGGGATVVQPDTGPALDDTALAAYRSRLAVLREELDAADAAADAARSAALHAELEALSAELRRATGLGGRARRSGGSHQRARTAVTGRIRDAIRRIGTVHPTLAEHLQTSIRTGAACAYQPQHPVDWQL